MRRLYGVAVLIGAIALFTAGCANEEVRERKYPVEFEPAVRLLSDNLLKQVKSNQSLISKLGQTRIVIDPFVDADTAEVTETSKEIEEIIHAEAKKTFPNFVVELLTPQNIGSADYVLNGIIKLDKYGEGQADSRYYHVSSSVVDLKTAIVIANADVWLSNKRLKHAPTGSYKESPMYLKDKRVDGLIVTARSSKGSKADREYYDTLETNALLVEADKAFDVGNYQRALLVFRLAAERKDGQVMKTYAGLYQCYRKLGMTKDAEEAFGKLVDIGYANNNLSTRLLFSVNSTEFISDPDLRNQYAIWLRQISRKFSSASSCLHIVGHSSRTGSEAYNENLSLQRAQAVQRSLQKDFASIVQRSRAIGRGYRDNIIGTGTDDTQDAIDRRVEFLIVDCRKL